MNVDQDMMDVSITQSDATIVKPILAGHVDPLRTLLQSIGNDIEGNPLIPFATLPSVHFMSWFIVEDLSTGPCLFLELNVDGTIETALQDIASKGGNGLDQIYSHCADYPASGAADPTRLVPYLMHDDIGYDCYYIGWRGLSVQRILQERDLRARLEDFLDAQQKASPQPANIREKIQAFVDADATLSWAKTFPPRPFLVRYSAQVVMALGAVGILILLGLLVLAYSSWLRSGPWPDVKVFVGLLAIVGGFLALLRWHEATDSVAVVEPNHDHVQTVTERENFVVQNHFASVADVKPGLFRMLILKTVLKLIHLLAAIASNQGSLSGITSIHFARWVVIDRGKKLLFLSNYDGSWENYLDDFIDRASNGLTAIWSNTIGFPRTSFLVNGGARDELLFKTLTRRSQRPSLVWYSAYPDLSMQNIQSNAAIREGLFAKLTPAAEQTWLRNF
jgi:hypothetical protein